jgi:hypothetical protein
VPLRCEGAGRVRVAALFVDRRGPYWGRDDVDAWDEKRDARTYAGPYSVVCHPPCQRWGRYHSGGPNPNARRRELGDDNGCFEFALHAVRKYGGVLEHPEASHAFKALGLGAPPKTGGWHVAPRGWICCVEQNHYGHSARKATWLYCAGDFQVETFAYRVLSGLPELIWGKSAGIRLDEGFHSKAERDAARAAGKQPVKRLSTVQNIVTPPAFAELLIGLARAARKQP